TLATKSRRVVSLSLIHISEPTRLLLTRDVTQLERLETTRRDFVANVSHELKTPLTVLAGFLETMQSLPLTPAQQQEVLATMTSQAERMQRIIDDLLILSRLESEVRPPNDSEIDMSAMVERLAREAQYLSRDRHVVRASSEGCSARLLGDDQELASAFGNLVSNAVRYTPEGGEVSISWSCTPEGEGVFCVRDTGPGIESQHIGRLTERFYRVDKGRSRDKGGTGLGLAIVKHIASRHEAELRIQSEVGRGSLFEIVFPKPRVLTASVTA
ncbi:MAG: phosphate regulon sensor histidine kinase PhoR, partial [Betaproteobacteria bacterium]|nr:phosphate regulon sensor histidine kinase PhoR [Betaproteobacteria bacterium]